MARLDKSGRYAWAPIPKQHHDPEVVNLVFTGHFRCESLRRDWEEKLPLREITEAIFGCFSHEEFRSVTLKAIDPDVTIHIYSNGVFIACGARSVLEVHVHIWRLVARLADVLGLFLKVLDIEKSNTVVAFTTGFVVDLNDFYRRNMRKSEYDPRKYPAVSYKPLRPMRDNPCLVIHASGAVNVVGADSFWGAITLFRSIDFSKYALK
jgi:TATA-box binding protein (TBP) (component of TFIID and TFIIIB)